MAATLPVTLNGRCIREPATFTSTTSAPDTGFVASTVAVARS